MTTIVDKLKDWRTEDIGNLASIVGIESANPTPDDIENAIKWLYYSKKRAKLRKHTSNTLSAVLAKIQKTSPTTTDEEALYKPPAYTQLLEGAALQLKVYDKEYSIEALEQYISHAVIINALTKMKPTDREIFFTT